MKKILSVLSLLLLLAVLFTACSGDKHKDDLLLHLTFD